MKYFLDKYDCIFIGASLANLTGSIELAKKGLKVLVLERHNLAGGLATSYVRDGVEIDATLHELLNVGSAKDPLYVRETYDEIERHIDWLEVPESYRLKDKETDITIYPDFERSAREIDKLCPGNYEKLMEFFEYCKKVSNSVDVFSNGIPKKRVFRDHKEFFKTLSHSTLDIFKKFEFSDEVIKILSVYWIYLGTPIDILPFTIFAIIVNGYIGTSAYIPSHTSYEMAANLEDKALSLGVQIECLQNVSKILVKKRKAYAVKLENGTIINSDIIVCGSYPNTAFFNMIEPINEVPKLAIKYVNSKKLNMTAFCLMLVLDKPYEEFNIHEYSTFYSSDLYDSKKIYDKSFNMEDYDFLTSVCYNVANKNASPEGTCVISLSTYPRIEAWDNYITEYNYKDTKEHIASYLIDMAEKLYNTDIRSHILNIEYETPVSIAHFTNSYGGAIYGYEHSLVDHIIARFIQKKKNHYIKNLFFAGAHTLNGDGMAPAISNGKITADIAYNAYKKINKNNKKENKK